MIHLGISETSPIDRFGREFRIGRLDHAVSARALLEQSDKDSDSLLVKQTYQESVRIIDYGIVSLFLDIVRRGKPFEIVKAMDTIQMLRSYLHPDQGVIFLDERST